MAAKRRPAVHKRKSVTRRVPTARTRKKAAPAKERRPWKTASAPVVAPRNPAGAPASAPNVAATGGAKGLRVRMYRVGFGDFFLLTVPTTAGSKHILIDCGVHAKDLGSIKEAINQMRTETGGELALLIMTHRHADHISGFATCKDVFSQFTIERVWMSWFENPGDKSAANFQSNLVAVATQLKMALAARTDPDSTELNNMAENITGEALASGGGSNAVALSVLHGGFKNQPPIDYYQAGDTPTLPQDLIDAGLKAQILGPPIDPALVSQMNGKNEQYLATNDSADSTTTAPLFPRSFDCDEKSYPAEAFDSGKIEQSVDDVQPDLLAAKARQADNTLNNQSLVILFTFNGKTLLFVGDAQWGNWENFLFGGPVGTAGHTDLSDKSKAILGAVDFYKVGHHGSTNATPIDAANALKDGCVAMCSTEPGAYGSVANHTEVPRIPLLEALGKKTNNQLVRSDQITVKDHPPTEGLSAPGAPFTIPTANPSDQLYVDYDFTEAL